MYLEAGNLILILHVFKRIKLWFFCKTYYFDVFYKSEGSEIPNKSDHL